MKTGSTHLLESPRIFQNTFENFHTHRDVPLSRRMTQNLNNFEFNTSVSHLLKNKEKDLTMTKKEFEDFETKLSSLIETNKDRITKLEHMIKENKNKLHIMINEQREYYLDILKKGIDVRSEGLCWILKKLLEMKCHFDYQNFPNFLEGYQKEYIVNLSKKKLEAYHMHSVLNALKTRQKTAKEYERKEESEQIMKSSKYSFAANFLGISNHKETKSGFFKTIKNIGDGPLYDKILQIMENIYERNDTMMKVAYEQRLEDFKVKIYFNYFRLMPFLEK